MGPGRHDFHEFMEAADADPDLLIDLALSVGAAAAWSLDLSTDTLNWTRGLEDMLGSTDERLLRERLTTLVAPVTVAARTATVWQDFDLEQPCEYVDGTTRWLQIRARVAARADRRCLVGVVTNVTGRRTERQALSDLTDRYRLLVDLSPDGI